MCIRAALGMHSRGKSRTYVAVHIITCRELLSYANSKGRSAVNDNDTAATTLAARQETH